MNNSNRHNKKYLSGSLLPLVCAGVLSACATDNPNTPKPFVQPDDPVVITPTKRGSEVSYKYHIDEKGNKVDMNGNPYVETPTVATTTPNGETHYTTAKIVKEQANGASVQAALQQPVTQATATQARVVPADNYAARRSVSVIPDNGKVYIKKRPDNTTTAQQNGVHNIVSQYGENHTVHISLEQPNIILTPFESAKAVGMDSKEWDMGNNGKAILIKPKSAKKLWISITDAGNAQSVPISLTLIPKKGLNSQTIIASVAVGATNKTAATGYSQSLSDILKAIANKQLPDGYVIQPLRHTFEMANGVSVKPIEHYSDNHYDIYRYRLTNRTGIEQTLAEEMFANDSRIVAVSFYPKTVLHNGEKTDVLIMVAKGEQ